MKAVRLEDLQYFVDSFEENCETQILEGKEKDDLTKIAEARGIKIKGSRDLGIFKTIYGFTDKKNKNNAILPQDELLKVLPQIIGKPVSVNHNRRLVVGSYIDYRYIQNEKKIIAYGIFYKSNFPELWEKAQELFKQKKLSSSFEIWSPTKNRKYNADGSYELHQMEIAGGALIYQDKDNTPAFEGADVLAMAKENKEEGELVYAKKHKEEEIILSNQWKDSIEQNLKKLQDKKQAEVKVEETPVQAQPIVNAEPIVPEIPKTKCANCQLEFDYNKVTETCMGAIKCPSCKAVIDQSGKMLYPPQIVDFRVGCPACASHNWVILSQDDKKANLKCSNCSKDYTVAFKQPEYSEELRMIKFLYTGHVSCIQCGNRILISGTSDMKEHEVNCKRCGLKFSVNTEKIDKTRQIESINETSSEERRKEEEMTKETEKKEEKAEVKVEEPKATETPKAEEPKVEKKEEVKPEPVAQASVEPEQAKETSEEQVIDTPTTSEESKESETVVTPQENASAKVIEEPVNATTEVKVEDSASIELPKEEKVEEAKKAEPCEEQEDEEKECEECKKLKAVCNKQKQAIKKAVCKIRQMKKATKLEKSSVEAKELEIAKIKEEAETKIQFYMEQAKTVVERRLELGEYGKDLSDKDIINDEVFKNAKLEKENADLRAKNESTSGTIAVASSLKDATYYDSKRKEIDAKAFGGVKRD